MQQGHAGPELGPFRPAGKTANEGGGIAVLIGILSESRKKEQAVRMTGLSAHFQKIFAMVGLTKYAQIHLSEEAALADF